MLLSKEQPVQQLELAGNADAGAYFTWLALLVIELIWGLTPCSKSPV